MQEPTAGEGFRGTQLGTAAAGFARHSNGQSPKAIVRHDNLLRSLLSAPLKNARRLEKEETEVKKNEEGLPQKQQRSMFQP